MALIVQKYGGSSVKDLERIQAVAARVKQTCEEGNQVVVVVSARGGVTNRLVADAKTLHEQPDDREMDMLLSIGEQETIALTSIALHAIGQPAVSRTGAQAGIVTDSVHTKARLIDISGGDIPQQLNDGKVVIVAGFQGMNETGQITTLGRGGSDLSAIALAAALKADICQIYTDVDGVYTADPRVVPNARKLPEIAYEEMLELASLGSKVMQSRAVEFANKHDVPFEVRNSYNNNPGTIVKADITLEDVVVRGVACDKNQTKVVVSELPDQPGAAAKVFQDLSDAKVNVDMIVQNLGRDGIANLTFTVASDEAYKAEKAVTECLGKLGRGKVDLADRMAKVSVVGIGMRSHSGVASKMFTALAENGINIQLISTSEIKISVAVDLEKADDAVRVIHTSFDLDKE
ncbi:aspartate kinase [Puniceicoccales bacterium CK1056]|uniref:Aspartokinase n=1 Tax=Oceanipulchritudo coccoides TaxID=2706888 RepID=A0A6B2LZF2_9BACT|nr:aspartate kinase [Oceanipulchritudo coccoides]NDV61823.1 aspartate kinase [Oceanipulchritudo coccoides]